MAVLLSIPILSVLMLLQAGIFSRLPLLRGTPDLLLLAIVAWALQKRVQTAWQWAIAGGVIFNIVSALPFGVPLIAYTLATGIALFLRRLLWQLPILAMLATVFLGTLVSHGVSLIALRLAGDPIPVVQALNLITLPSLFLNLVLAVPLYALMGDLAKWLYPEPLEV